MDSLQSLFGLRGHLGLVTGASSGLGVECAHALALAADIDRAIETSRAKLGDVDILINNAGVSPTGRAEYFKRELWDNAMAVNLTAPMLLSQRVARRLIHTQQP